MVLWVDDDEFAAFRLSEPLSDFGVRVVHADGPDDAIYKLRRYRSRVKLVVIDVMMPPSRSFSARETHAGIRTGIILARQLKRTHPEVRILGCSLSDEDGDWFRKNASGFIRKGTEGPADVAMLVAGILKLSVPLGLRRVFIVHGRDDRARREVEAYVRSRGLLPIVLRDEPDGGMHVFQKLELNAAVDFALVLLTPDDVGALGTAPAVLRGRARQNVVFELGYFCARIGIRRVRALKIGDVELPSDYHGIVYIDVDPTGEWTSRLDRELRSAGVLT